MKRAGYFMVVGAAMQWGLWPLVLFLADSIRPTNVALQSAIVMATITLFAAALLRKDRLDVRATKLQWLGLAWLGFGDAMNIYFVFKAYATTSVGIAVTTHYLAPVLVAALSPLVLRERPSARTWSAVAIALAGLVLMVRLWADDVSPKDAMGAVYGSASAVFYATNVLVTKRLAPAFSGTELMFWHGVVALPILALFVPHDAWTVDPRAAAVLVVGGLGPGALGGLLFVWAIRRIPASHAMTLTLLEPLTAFVVGFAALRQSISAISVIGGVLILVAAAVVLSSNSPSEPVNSEA
jgi:drug/metabolite transporter (DMT)-like permease